MTIEHTLLISQPFALRKHGGIPVFTEIKTKILPHGKEFIDRWGYLEKKGYKLTDKKKALKTDHPIDLHEIDRIILTPNAKGYISTYFLDFAKEYNIAIYWVDVKGRGS